VTRSVVNGASRHELSSNSSFNIKENDQRDALSLLVANSVVSSENSAFSFQDRNCIPKIPLQ
jgi:hypothetical protein